MSERLTALRASQDHLESVAASLDSANYTAPAYPSEWSVADTFSHLGSGAVIGRRNVTDYLSGEERPADFNAGVWDEWNAKDPSAQVHDALTSSAAYLETLEGTTEEQRRGYEMAFGPHRFDFDGVLGLRLGEQVLHTWDIEVPFAPSATLDEVAAGLILERVGFLVTRTAKLDGGERVIGIRTHAPGREYSLLLGPEVAELSEGLTNAAADLEISSEALVRLFYGRLDDAHTPDSLRDSAVVGYLRGVFTGF